MDSLSQLALGAAVGVAVMGRRTAVWKAALWGGICGTLPDLDALIDHGDAVRNMTFHRAESHAIFYQTLASPVIAWLISRLHGQRELFSRWWLAVWLALVTHALLDLMTVYGTQIALPFTDRPFGVGSIFIIDPLYTLPLLVGLGVALARGHAGWRWNAAGLAVSCAYLVWSVLAQQWAGAAAMASLKAQGVQARAVLVTPTAFNTVLWRVVAITPQGYLEGFHSLLDDDPTIHFEAHDQGLRHFDKLRGNWNAERIAWFSRGFFKVEQADGRWVITDLRMGQEPMYVFRFIVAEHRGGAAAPVTPQPVGSRIDIARGVDWLVRRAGGERIPSPR